MVPFNQVCQIEKPQKDLDAWGQPKPGELLTYKCRIDQTSKLVKTQSGEEVVSNTQILFGGLVQVGYSDLIYWVDEIGNEYAKNPLEIVVKRDLSGKALATVVRL